METMDPLEEPRDDFEVNMQAATTNDGWNDQVPVEQTQTGQVVHLPRNNSMLHSTLSSSLPRVAPSVPNVRNRLQHFKDARRTMTEGLLNANEDLLDLASDLQAQVLALEQENTNLRSGVPRLQAGDSTSLTKPSDFDVRSTRAFAVILLDADAYCFRHEFLVDGSHGGRRAADELYLRASEYLRQDMGKLKAQCGLF